MWKLAAVLVAVTALAACNTVSGAGQDIQNAGQAIEGVAKDAAQ